MRLFVLAFLSFTACGGSSPPDDGDDDDGGVDAAAGAADAAPSPDAHVGGTDGELIYTGDFEVDGEFAPGTTYPQFSSNIDTCEYEDACATDSLERVTSPVRAGGHAVRFTLRDGDTQSTSGTRAELQTKGFYTTDLDTDYWYGFSIYVPDSWDLTTSDMKVVHQWHTGGSNPGPSPIIGLRIRGANWQITRELDADAIDLWHEPVVKEQWVDWVMHVRWSTSDSGRFTVWRNGEQVHDETTQNLATGTTTGEHYQKFGLYGSFSDGITERVLYYDELRVAKGPDAYALVAP